MVTPLLSIEVTPAGQELVSAATRALRESGNGEHVVRGFLDAVAGQGTHGVLRAVLDFCEVTD